MEKKLSEETLESLNRMTLAYRPLSLMNKSYGDKLQIIMTRVDEMINVRSVLGSPIAGDYRRLIDTIYCDYQAYCSGSNRAADDDVRELYLDTRVRLLYLAQRGQKHKQHRESAMTIPETPYFVSPSRFVYDADDLLSQRPALEPVRFNFLYSRPKMPQSAKRFFSKAKDAFLGPLLEAFDWYKSSFKL